MLLQNILIVLLFLAATLYVGRIFWRAFFVKGEAGCPKGCGGACSVLDVDRLQRTIEARESAAAAK